MGIRASVIPAHLNDNGIFKDVPQPCNCSETRGLKELLKHPSIVCIPLLILLYVFSIESSPILTPLRHLFDAGNGFLLFGRNLRKIENLHAHR